MVRLSGFQKILPVTNFLNLLQLENMAVAVLKLAKDGDRIVDFCSGGGHLGIVLAYLLPKSTVYLVRKVKKMVLLCYLI